MREDLTAWGTGALTDEELDQLDQNAFASINGDDGGVWAPANAIIIGGQGLEVAGQFYASGNATIGSDSSDQLDINAIAIFYNSVQIGSDGSDALDVQAVATFFNNVEMRGDTTTIGNSGADDFNCEANAHFFDLVDFDLAVTFNGEILCADFATFQATATFEVDAVFEAGASFATGVDFDGPATFNYFTFFNDDATFGAPATFGEDVIISAGAALELNEALTFATNGRVPLRRYVAPNASTTLTVADGNVVRVASLTGPRTYTLDSVAAKDGDFFLFYTVASGAGDDFIVQPDSNGDTFTATAGAKRWALFVYEESITSWRVVLHNGSI